MSACTEFNRSYKTALFYTIFMMAAKFLSKQPRKTKCPLPFYKFSWGKLVIVSPFSCQPVIQQIICTKQHFWADWFYTTFMTTAKILSKPSRKTKSPLPFHKFSCEKNLLVLVSSCQCQFVIQQIIQDSTFW